MNIDKESVGPSLFTSHDELGSLELWAEPFDDNDGGLSFSAFMGDGKVSVVDGNLTRDEIIELAAACLAWLCNDVVNEAAQRRASTFVRAAAGWQSTRDRNPSGFRSMLSELAQLEARYPDLRRDVEGAES